MSSRNVRAALLLVLLAAGVVVLAILLVGPGASPDDPPPVEPFGAAASRPAGSDRGAISGRLVVFGSNRPAGEIPVRVEGAGEPIEVTSGPDGGFLALVPPDRPLTLVIDAPEPFAPFSVPGIELGAGGAAALGVIYLTPPFAVRGTVTDAAGAPVAGAVVEAHRPRLSELSPGVLDAVSSLDRTRVPVAVATTDDAGAFELAGMFPGTWRIEARADGFAIGARPEVTLTPDAARDPVDLVLGPGRVYAGVVRNADGEPLAGATVATLRAGPATEEDPRFSPSRTTTGPDGSFRLAAVAPGPLALLAFAPDHPTRLVDAPAGSATDIEIVVGGTASIEGRVTGPEGAPVAGARVVTVVEAGAGAVGWTRTDADGRYRLSHLPPGRVQLLLFDSERFAPWPTGSPGPRHDAFGTLEPGGKIVRDVALDPGTTLTGAILDGARGHPVAGARVRLVSPDTIAGTSAGRATIADENGRFVIEGVAAGIHLVVAEADGYFQPGTEPEALQALFRLAGTPEEPPVDSPMIRVRGGQPRKQKNIPVLPGATVLGRVLDPDGAPVSGARVEAALETSEGPGPVDRGSRAGSSPVLTDGEGRFQLTGAATSARVIVLASADGFVDGATAPFAASPGQVVEDVEIRVGAGATLSGTVLDAAGEPLAGAEVRVLSAERPGRRGPPGAGSRPERTTETGADGRFVVDLLPAGAWTLVVEDESHLPAVRPGLELAEGGTVDLPAIRLGGGRWIEGRVAGAGGGPLAGARVELMPLEPVDPASPLATRAPPTVETGEDGRFRLGPVPPGRYAVTVASRGFAPERLEVTAGEAELAVALEPGRTIRGRVVGPDGAPAAGIRVSAHGEDGGAAHAVTGPDGEFRFTELHAGTFRIAATPQRFDPGPAGREGPDLRPATMDGVPAGAEDVEIRLRAALAIEGVVLDAEGRPLAGAVVEARGPEGQGFARSDARGVFRVRGLGEGDYTLRAEHPPTRARAEVPGVAAGATGVRVVVTVPPEEPK